MGHPTDILSTQQAVRRPLVLIVGRDAGALSAYERRLKLDGFRPVAASTLADAWRLVHEVHPSAALLDHLLSDGEDASICAELRRINGNALPIVLVNGLDPGTLTAVVKLLIRRPRKASRQRSATRSEATIGVRCPRCGAPGARLGPKGAFRCKTCGKSGTLQRDQFIDAGN